MKPLFRIVALLVLLTLVSQFFRVAYGAIAPDLLQKLSSSPGSVERKLSPEKAKAVDMPKVKLDESAFRWLHNEDAMASDKLAEGIHRFDADARKLEKLITSLAAATPVTAK